MGAANIIAKYQRKFPLSMVIKPEYYYARAYYIHKLGNINVLKREHRVKERKEGAVSAVKVKR